MIPISTELRDTDNSSFLLAYQCEPTGSCHILDIVYRETLYVSFYHLYASFI